MQQFYSKPCLCCRRLARVHTINSSDVICLNNDTDFTSPGPGPRLCSQQLGRYTISCACCTLISIVCHWTDTATARWHLASCCFFRATVNDCMSRWSWMSYHESCFPLRVVRYLHSNNTSPCYKRTNNTSPCYKRTKYKWHAQVCNFLIQLHQATISSYAYQFDTTQNIAEWKNVNNTCRFLVTNVSGE